MTSETKKAKIRATLLETKKRRSLQTCRIIELKLDYSHLNKKEIERLKMYFVEAKWLYNHILNQEDVFKYNTKTNNIQKMNKDGELEDVVLQYLPAQCKQSLLRGMQTNIKGLSSIKKKGKCVGKLKHKSDCNSIDLPQYGGSYKILNKKRIKIVGIKRHILIRGAHQITDNMEIANAHLVKKPNGYYLKVTTFQFQKEEKKEKKQAVGIDFGIKNNLVTSDGEVFNICVEESERLKRLQKKFSKAVKGSNNRYKIKNLIQREYQKITNKKKDKANKIVHHLLSNYHQVFIQDENLRGWKSGWFGKQVQHSAMGTIKAKLRSSKQVTMINRFLPTTKMCPNCGVVKDKVALSERWFNCDCGYSEDRDIKAAKTIMKLGLILVGTERIEFKPVEQKTSLDKISSESHTVLKQEALSLIL